jgi:hypothetical protein
MKLPPRLANWLRARRRVHEQHETEHLRIMAKVDMAPRYGRKVRIPAPPGGWQNGGGKQPSANRPKNHGRPLPPPKDRLAEARQFDPVPDHPSSPGERPGAPDRARNGHETMKSQKIRPM